MWHQVDIVCSNVYRPWIHVDECENIGLLDLFWRYSVVDTVEIKFRDLVDRYADTEIHQVLSFVVEPLGLSQLFDSSGTSNVCCGGDVGDLIFQLHRRKPPPILSRCVSDEYSKTGAGSLRCKQSRQAQKLRNICWLPFLLRKTVTGLVIIAWIFI